MEGTITGVIVDIHKSDAWYSEYEKLVGKRCTLDNVCKTRAGYVSGDTLIDGIYYIFHAVKIQ